MTVTPLKKRDQGQNTPVYNGPIFDSDSHIQELNFSMMAKYLPEKYHEDWLIQSKYDDAGEYSLFLGKHKVENTEFATAAAVTAAVLNGAHLVRVHDVKAMKTVVEVADEIAKAAAQ